MRRNGLQLNPGSEPCVNSFADKGGTLKAYNQKDLLAKPL